VQALFHLFAVPGISFSAGPLPISRPLYINVLCLLANVKPDFRCRWAIACPHAQPHPVVTEFVGGFAAFREALPKFFAILGQALGDGQKTGPQARLRAIPVPNLMMIMR
jgi:hypothetical protein